MSGMILCVSRMGPGSQQSLVFLGLPDLKKLCCVTLTLQDDDDDELRSKQMKTCRCSYYMHGLWLQMMSRDEDGVKRSSQGHSVGL